MAQTSLDLNCSNHTFENGKVHFYSTKSKDNRGCICSRISIIHALVLALCGIVYLVIGGVVGFHLGQKCKLYYNACKTTKSNKKCNESMSQRVGE